MKLLVTWTMHEGKLHETLEQFASMTDADEQAMMGNVRRIGRWHDVARGRGAAVYEVEDAAAFSSYALRWNHAMDIDVSVVLDDDETRALGQKG